MTYLSGASLSAIGKNRLLVATLFEFPDLLRYLSIGDAGLGRKAASRGINLVTSSMNSPH